jgi:uncharacterized membrane protein
MLIIVLMVIASMFVFARLVRGVGDLLVTNTLRAVGDRGRVVLRQTFDRLEGEGQPRFAQEAAVESDLRTKAVSQTLRYVGVPRSIAEFDQDSLADLALQFNALIEIDCAVGDTLVYDTKLLRIRGASRQLPEKRLWRAIHSPMNALSNRTPSILSD